jgi:hypothetical protein
VDGVDVVPVDHLEHGGEHGPPRAGVARVDPLLRPVAHHPLGPGRAQARGAHGFAAGLGRRRAERVHPDVQLQAAAVRLREREGERVVAGLVAVRDEVARPRSPGRRVHGVGGGPHVQDHGVQTDRRRAVEDVAQLVLLRRVVEVGRGRPLAAVDGRDPRRAELAGRARRGERVGAGRGCWRGREHRAGGEARSRLRGRSGERAGDGALADGAEGGHGKERSAGGAGADGQKLHGRTEGVRVATDGERAV